MKKINLGIKSNLPTSAAPDTLWFTSDTNEIFKGTGSGLKQYEFIQVYDNIRCLPTTGSNNLYLVKDTRTIYIWDTSTAAYVAAIDLNDAVMSYITNDTILDGSLSDRVLSTNLYTGNKLVIRLPVYQAGLKFTIVHESKTPCSIVGNIFVSGLGSTTSLDLRPYTIINILADDGKWVVSVASMDKNIQGGAPGIYSTSFIFNPASTGSYMLRHMLNAKYVNINIIAADTNITQQCTLSYIDDNSALINFNQYPPTGSTITVVAGIGVIENYTIPIRPGHRSLTIPHTATTEHLILDYTKYMCVKLTLHDNVNIEFTNLKSNSSRRIYLELVQDASTKYGVSFTNLKSSNTININTALAPNIGTINLITVFWSGTDFIVESVKRISMV